jgi:hypothetical protein
MNVKKLLTVLQKEVKPCDRENAEIEIFCGEQQYEIKEISGFSLSPSIVLSIKPIKLPMLKPAVFKKEHKKLVSKMEKEIKELQGREAAS